MLFSNKKHLNTQELSAFCDQLAMITAAGIPAYEGISLLMRHATDESFKSFLSSLYTPLESGTPLYEVLDACDIFPPYMIHMVKIGEQSGHLEEALSSLARYYDQKDNLRSGIRHAIVYPALMTLVMLIVLAILITKVLPVFQQVYQELGSNLHGFALSIMKASSFLSNHMIPIVLTIAVLIVALWLYLHSRFGQHILQRSKIITAISTCRFASCMAMMLSSGMDSTQSICLAEELADNRYLSKKIHICRKQMESGEGLYESMLVADIFSPLNASLLSIGIRTGSLEQTLYKISDSYEEEANQKISNLISVLEPSLVIILSIIIGIIIISFLMPLIAIMSSIG
jgi:type IV pilus assembly protein PilC